ncbi:MAG TPA: acetamidase/formamidase family protein [Tahibacter sp.]|uniref:acetamidase/formamidase family protein n=1 Tax=Tahibacter sp. TaxID=2056211 RepID=UPI002C5C5C02|nr:acetamidase/formamidase family protein [Tahibacter sp.]HSX62527.1 acetamidase/formamidase family protein [Tahibacter sp.]
MSIRALLLLFLACSSQAAGAADESWLLTLDRWGNPQHETLSLARDGNALSGFLAREPLTGTLRRDRLRFRVVAADGSRCDYDGRRERDRLRGVADCPDTNDPDRRAQHAFSARRLPTRPSQAPRVHDYVPTDFSNTFSAERLPVLTIWPGDSVRTKTIDSGGVDEHGRTVALYGNPQTGPFFVAGAEPGDTLAVRIVRLRLNRDYADSLDGIVARALTTTQAVDFAHLGKPARWTLDRERGVARPQRAGGALDHFEVPLRPMLGGLGVAPGPGSPPMSTGDTGRHGGNMDFNEIVEGSTVLLPVFQPGALLYLGDAHALQGDGETSQFALETSMEVEIHVELLRGKTIAMPRVESADAIHVLGQAGSLDDALRAATAGMLQWLRQDYGLDAAQAAQVLGSSVRYRVANLAGRSVGLAASIDTARLATLRPERSEAAR